MATENISTGNFYRILKDKATSTWDRISFWTHASDVELSSGTSLETDLSNKTEQIEGIQSDFAQIEPTSVSSHVYTKGMMLVYNNQLYRATSAIASGETLVVGTNIESASVGTLSNMLSASNGNQFYFDVKDGTYGFYPSASKTASEFVPFGGTGAEVYIKTFGFIGNYTYRASLTDIPNYQSLIMDNNLFVQITDATSGSGYIQRGISYSYTPSNGYLTISSQLWWNESSGSHTITAKVIVV